MVFWHSLFDTLPYSALPSVFMDFTLGYEGKAGKSHVDIWNMREFAGGGREVVPCPNVKKKIRTNTEVVVS